MIEPIIKNPAAEAHINGPGGSLALSTVAYLRVLGFSAQEAYDCATQIIEQGPSFETLADMVYAIEMAAEVAR